MGASEFLPYLRIVVTVGIGDFSIRPPRSADLRCLPEHPCVHGQWPRIGLEQPGIRLAKVSRSVQYRMTGRDFQPPLGEASGRELAFTESEPPEYWIGVFTLGHQHREDVPW